MKAERWKQIDQILEAALEREPGEWPAFLDESCGGDEELRREVETLLRAHEEAGSFIEEPLVEAAAEALKQPTAGLLTGERIGPYELTRLLGSGGMGEVYLALDRRLGRSVAIKVLGALFTQQDEERARRFRQEARAASALNHPNILTIHEIGHIDGRHFIATEYIEGETLRRRMKRTAIEIHEAVGIAEQIASALAAAGSAGIVHRDIKPENIMVRKDGIVKVLDFGLAKLLEQERAASDTEALTKVTANTAPGIIMGTVAYMSPEQARGKEVDARTDVWSLGVVLYEMLSGRRPFEGETTTDVLVSLLEREPAPLQQFLPEIPAEIQRITSKALQKKRDERYRWVTEMLHDLSNIRKELEFRAKLKRSAHPEVIGAADQSRSSTIVAAETGATAASSGNQKRDETAVPDPLPGKAKVRTGRNWAHYLRSPTKVMPPGVFKVGAITICVALVIAAVSTAFIGLWSKKQVNSSHQPARRALTRLTFDAGLQDEPAWSADGRFIAYSANHNGNFAIRVQPVGEGSPVQVTTAKAQDWQPDWSPDGTHLVFRSEREGGGLYIVPALGGNERRISSFGYRPRWSPDGSQILFYGSMMRPSVSTPSVYLVGLDGKPPREVISEFLHQFTSFRTGFFVAWHPDGQRISLLGNHLKFGFSFWTIPVSGGTPVKSDPTPQVEQGIKEAGVEFSSFAWAPSGRILYFEGFSQGVRNLWKIEVDPQTLQWMAGPERLTTGPGADANVAISPDGRKLSFSARNERTRVWLASFDAKSGRVKGDWRPVTSADRDAWLPSLSPDGEKLAFVSQPSGKQEFWDQSLRELWVKSLSDGSETLLAGGDGFSRYGPVWSHDGQFLAYLRFRATNPEHTQFERSIVIKPTAGGEERMLTSAGPPGELPLDWSADGAWVLGNSERQTLERFQLCLFPVSAAPHAETQMRVIAAHPDYSLWQARFSPRGRWISFNAAKSGGSASVVCVMPASGGDWVRITEGKYWDDKPRWAPDDRTIYFLSNRSGFFNVWGLRFNPELGKPVGAPFRVTNFESPAQMISPIVASAEISLAGDHLVADITEASGNIWILDNIDR